MTEFESVSASLHTNLSFLNQWKLEPCDDDISHSTLLGERLLITYSSKMSGRSVRVYYSSASAGKPAKFSTFIDSGDGQSFFLDDYLLEHGQKKILRLFRNESPEKPTAEFSRDFARILQVVLENSFSNLLLGKSWEVAPFDWSPYK
jgi:hypothetical protein